MNRLIYTKLVLTESGFLSIADNLDTESNERDILQDLDWCRHKDLDLLDMDYSIYNNVLDTLELFFDDNVSNDDVYLLEWAQLDIPFVKHWFDWTIENTFGTAPSFEESSQNRHGQFKFDNLPWYNSKHEAIISFVREYYHEETLIDWLKWEFRFIPEVMFILSMGVDVLEHWRQIVHYLQYLCSSDTAPKSDEYSIYTCIDLAMVQINFLEALND